MANLGQQPPRVWLALRRAGMIDGAAVLEPALLADLYETQGWSIAELRAVSGASRGRVLAALADAGVDTARRRPADWAPVLTKEYLQRRYQRDGASLETIAAEVGCTHATVRRHLIRHGLAPRAPVPTRPRRPLADLLTAEVLEQLYVREQLTSIEIAAAFGCSHVSVLDYLRRHGIPRRPATWRAPAVGPAGGPVAEAAVDSSCSPASLYRRRRLPDPSTADPATPSPAPAGRPQQRRTVTRPRPAED